MSEEQRSSYSQILRATSIIGGAQGINLLLGMVRIKFAAMLIGPLGIGIINNLGAIQGLIGTLAGLGIQSSAVRDVAEAVGQGDQDKIGRTVLALRRICWLTGLVGALSMAALSPWLSQWTFGSDQYTLEIAAMGLMILFGNLAGGQTALIQGMRRIGDLARLSLVGSVAGTAISITCYYYLGLKGIVPALLLLSATQLAAAWYYASKVPVPKVSLTWRETLTESGSMVRLGVIFMWNGLLLSAVGYATNALITQQISLAAVGIFGAAFSLSGMLMNFILQAMGADYYPRLTTISHDKEAMCRLVNQQTEIGLLLAAPGLIAMMTLAPWVIKVFYTAEFMESVKLIHWFVLGCLGRVIAWPLGFVMLAMKKNRWFFVTETTTNLLHLGLVYLGLVYWGLEGAAFAFFAMYVFYIGFVYFVARRLINFQWCLDTRGAIAKLVMIFLVLITVINFESFISGYFSELVLCSLGLLFWIMIFYKIIINSTNLQSIRSRSKGLASLLEFIDRVIRRKPKC